MNGIGAANAKPTSGSANSAVTSIAPGISKTNPLVGNNAESSTIPPTDITPSDAAKTPNIPQNTVDSGNTPSDTAVVTSAAAAKKISTQNLPTGNTAVPETSVKTNTSGELDEIMSSEPITTFTPKTAGSEIKRLENILIEKGADDISRKEIIDTAVEIEKAHDGSDKNIRNIFNDVSKITNAAVNEMQGQTDLKFSLNNFQYVFDKSV